MAVYDCNGRSANEVTKGGGAAETRRAIVANAFLILLGGLIVVASFSPSASTMETCQRSHGFDTCFATLNR